MLMSYQACLVLDSTTSSCFNNSAPLRGSDDLTGVSTESETNSFYINSIPWACNR